MSEHNYDEELGPPQEFRFQYSGKRYVLREPSADAGRLWRNAQTAGATMKDERVTLPETLADSETVLVAGCLFQIVDEKERPLPLSQVRALPDRLTEDLFKRAKAMLELKKGSEKNLPSNGTPTSASLETSASTSTS